MITLNNEQLERLAEILKVDSRNTLLAGCMRKDRKDTYFRYKNAFDEELVGYYYFDKDEQDKVKYILGSC
jgi:hypothetical protein